MNHGGRLKTEEKGHLSTSGEIHFSGGENRSLKPDIRSKVSISVNYDVKPKSKRVPMLARYQRKRLEGNIIVQKSHLLYMPGGQKIHMFLIFLQVVITPRKTEYRN